jgi:WD40 repeat protein
MTLMRRNRSRTPDDSGWYGEFDDPRTGPKAGRSTGSSAWTGGGLTLASLAVLGLAWLSWEPEKPATRARFQRTPTPMGSVAFAPDGRSVALGRSDGGLVIEDLSGGRPREFEGGPGFGVLLRGLAYSPDGKTIASSGRGTLVKLWDVATGSLRASFEGHSAPVACLAFSPDGKAIASGSLDGVLKLWDVDTGEEITRIAGHSKDIRGLAFSPDGKTLASGSLDGSAKLWDVATGRELAAVQGGGRRVYSLAFAPDGKSLALALSASTAESSGKVVIWTPGETRRPFQVLGAASIATVAFSPDGKTLAAAGGDRVVKLWDVATGEEIASLAGHEGFIASLAFSPDGQALITAGEDNLVGLFELDPAKLKPAKHHL